MPKITIQQNIPLAPFTTFRIGGPAKFFCAVKNEAEILEALDFAREKKLNIFILSGGSNILVSDDGFDGLVIHFQDTRYKIQDTKIECGAGLSLSKAVGLAAENSLAGLEWAAGIPGTIGGAIRGNAGAFGSDMAKIAENVNVCEINTPEKHKILKQKDCAFSYRNSIFKENKNLIILSVKLKLKKGNREEIERKMKEIIEKRAKNQPKGFSAGSFFQNPIVENQKLLEQFEKDTGTKAQEGKIPAGWLIDEVGFRGKKIGGAMVSEKHANFIINTGNGTAQDVIMLASIIKQKLREEFGVQLKEEVAFIGF